MTDKLPPNLLALFAPRPPLRFLPPSDHAPEARKTANVSGLAAFLPQLQEYKETDVYTPTESWLEKRDRQKLEKKERQAQLLKDAPSTYKPQDDPNIRGDAFKTLIVARLSYEATEKDLEAEFARFGPIERIRIIVDTHQHEKPNKKKKKHRGYAFVVYEREKDMRAALDQCEGIRIKDRRIKVDVERGRTVKGWKPRRLGGGLGGRGYTKVAAPRPSGFSGPPGPGGFRGGGFRGGFDGGRGRGGFRGGGGFQDRGSFGGGGGGGGGRGGVGYQGDRGFSSRGGYGGGGGDRGGYGGGSNGYSAPPNAPAGPGGRGGGGFGGGRGSYSGSPDRNGSGMSAPGGGYESRGGRSYEDRNGGYRGGDRGYGGRDGPRGGGSGSNMEPVRPRDSGAPRDGGYRDRDRDGGYGGDRPRDDSRKRGYEPNSYEEDPRKLRRY